MIRELSRVDTHFFPIITQKFPMIKHFFPIHMALLRIHTHFFPNFREVGADCREESDLNCQVFQKL
jgi:hypothetical protein